MTIRGRGSNSAATDFTINMKKCFFLKKQKRSGKSEIQFTLEKVFLKIKTQKNTKEKKGRNKKKKKKERVREREWRNKTYMWYLPTHLFFV